MGCKVKRMSTHCSPPQNKFRFSWPKDAVFMAHEDPVFIAKHPALITQSSGPPSSRKTLTASCASMRGLAAPWRLFSRRSRECHDEQSERGASRSARAHCANTRRQPLTCIGVTCELVPPLLHPLEAVQPLPRREQEPWDWRQREGQVVQVLSAGRTVSAKVRKLGERCCGALLKPLATGRDCLRGLGGGSSGPPAALAAARHARSSFDPTWSESAPMQLPRDDCDSGGSVRYQHSRRRRHSRCHCLRVTAAGETSSMRRDGRSSSPHCGGLAS